ncbi:MAG: hypothetical protein H0V61_09560 [Chitinophagales bacterium]|nr:hypothetical protein [Chitinophagales bacterium]
MEQVVKYFNAEKNESLLFIFVAIIAFLVSIYFLLKIKVSFFSGISLALMMIAAIQLFVGSTVYFRSSKDIERVTTFIENDRGKIQSEEIPRMKIVMKNFVIYRYVEMALTILGIILFFFFPSQTFWKGVGVGLFIQSILMLSFDYFAEKRGTEYLQYLTTINK